MTPSLRSLSLATLAALLLVAPGQADQTYRYDQEAAFRGKGTLEASGVGTAKVKGKCEIRSRGLGTVRAPAWVWYKTNLHPTTWKLTNGSPISGFGWILLRPDNEGQEVTLEGLAELHVHTRMGGPAEVTVSGKGSVRASETYLVLRGATAGN